MKRCVALATLLLLASSCSTSPKTEWGRADSAGDPEVVREQRAKDLADCVAVVGAPTQGIQSTGSLSRQQVGDCMRAKGWRRVPVTER